MQCLRVSEVTPNISYMIYTRTIYGICNTTYKVYAHNLIIGIIWGSN